MPERSHRSVVSIVSIDIPFIHLSVRAGQSPLAFALLSADLLLDLLSSLLQLAGLALSAILDLLAGGVSLQGLLVAEDTGGLCGADAEEQEVDTSEEQIPGLDNEAPTGPDEAGGHEGGVL